MAERGDSFTCAVCHRDFLRERSDAEALVEAEALIGGPIPAEDQETVCDDCHIKFMRWFEDLTPEQHREIQAEAAPTPDPQEAASGS